MTAPHLQIFSQALSAYKVDAYLVIHPVDIHYLTGFASRDAWLLVTPGRAYYMTDSRYQDEAALGVGRVAVLRIFKKSLEHEAAAILKEYGLRRAGFDEHHFSVARMKALKAALAKEARAVAVNGAIGRMRTVKTEDEICKIRRCLDINQKAYTYLKRILRPGMTERGVLERLERFVCRQGVAFAFDPIIASGPNSAFPHACVSTRIIKNKDIILIDIGIKYQGYNSDLTRIFLSDKITRSFRDIYQAVAEAQEAAVARIRDGAAAADIDLAARKVLRKNKLEKFFTHALGHGVGMDVHESPRLSVVSKDILKAGMVVTVEPGVYMPGRFGIRIEDMVLVKENGCEVLSRGVKVDDPICV